MSKRHARIGGKLEVLDLDDGGDWGHTLCVELELS
jgi:hypothetical protein